MPGFKSLGNASFYMNWLVKFAFEDLSLRVLDCELTLYLKSDRESAAAEKLLKRIGFKKRAVLPERLVIDGKPKDTLLLDYLKRDYDVKTKKIEQFSSGGTGSTE